MNAEYSQLQELIEATIDTEVEKRVGLVKKENSTLRVEIANLMNKMIDLTQILNKSKSNESISAIMLNIVNQLNYRIQKTEDKDKKEEFVYKFLGLLFESDFNESTYDVPTWLGAVTNFYSNKESVIQILNLLHVSIPDKIADFRLPMDWTESELDCFFETMSNHINCNGCVFSNNLRFWRPKSLYSVYDMTHSSFSEIPWQFVLRNPLLKKEKYLKLIAENYFDKSDKKYRSSNWNNFSKLYKYQKLTSEEINIFCNNINVEDLVITKKGNRTDFLLDNIKLIENKDIVEEVYKKYKDSCNMSYEHKILEFPIKYIEDWVKNYNDNPIYWIQNNSKYMTKEQKEHLLEIALKELLLE